MEWLPTALLNNITHGNIIICSCADSKIISSAAFQPGYFGAVSSCQYIFIQRARKIVIILRR